MKLSHGKDRKINIRFSERNMRCKNFLFSRLIYESEERCFVVHRMANSRIYEGRPEVLFDLDVEVRPYFFIVFEF